MKELYISPVLNVLCFAPVERLAGNGIVVNWEDLLQTVGGPASEAETGVDDVILDL